MKYCNKCGKELVDDAVVCPFCGCQVGEVKTEQKESSTIGILAIVFGALGGWLGLIFGAIGLCTYKDKKNRRNCKIGLGLFGAWVVVILIIVIASFATIASGI